MGLIESESSGCRPVRDGRFFPGFGFGRLLPHQDYFIQMMAECEVVFFDLDVRWNGFPAYLGGKGAAVAEAASIRRINENRRRSGDRNQRKLLREI